MLPPTPSLYTQMQPLANNPTLAAAAIHLEHPPSPPAFTNDLDMDMDLPIEEIQMKSRSGSRIWVSLMNLPHQQHDIYGNDTTEDPNTPPVPVHQRVPEHRVNENYVPPLHDLNIAYQFKLALENASLNNGDLDEEQLQLLQHPPQEPAQIDDRDLLLSIKLFISTTLAANKVYEDVHLNVMDAHSEDAILTHDAVKKAIAKLMGVVPIVHDMCLNLCMAYTGPWSALEWCPFCKTFRYDPVLFDKKKKKVAQRCFYTLPLGPILQAK
ncbi:hypothetical protein DXG01_004387 [Tephrocybe rancida]|nr:hypothetical protein DXG01_004387 [Tephrocybe rancida]